MMPPDLTNVSDAALSAFLHVVLFGVERALPTSHGGYGEVVGVKLVDLTDLCTPSGALRVIEALEERDWWIALDNDLLNAADNSGRRWSARLHRNLSRLIQPAHAAAASTFPRAVLEATTLALLPSASDEARRILRADTRATTDG